MSKSNHLIAAYRQLRLEPCDVVLATIVETFGSTYQKAGARMLIARDGELTGLLGGGCFERDLIEHARTVFDTGAAKLLFYDMRSQGDAVWGLGLGCNGAVRILLQLLTAADDFNPLNIVAGVGESHQSGLLATIIESSHEDFPVGQGHFLPAVNQRKFWPFTPEATSWQKPKLQMHTISGCDIRVFYDPLQPPTHLLLIGAGDDAMPLVRCAKALGWRVSVADYRPAYLTERRFALADLLLHITPEGLGRRHLELSHFNAVVLMTHNVDRDRRYLAALEDSTIPFIGLLGPVHRREHLLQSLDDIGERLRERVCGPVGLDIGAETPEEIALAIVAGVQAKLKGRRGGQLGALDNAHSHECLPR